MVTQPPAVLIIHAVGPCVPQGSKVIRHRGRKAYLVDSNADELAAWRRKIGQAAKIATHPHQPWEPLDTPCAVDIEFHFTRPQSHYRTGRNAHLLHEWAPVYRAGTPDRDKLERAVNDALTVAGIWTDDARSVTGSSRKLYVDRDQPPGCIITITPLHPAPTVTTLVTPPGDDQLTIEGTD